MSDRVTMRGTVQRVIHVRGYGFVKDEHGKQRFLHAKDLVDATQWAGLQEGQEIQFEHAERKRPGQERGLGCARVVLV